MLIKFLVFFTIYLFLTNLAINIGYHRYLAHKSFEMVPWFKYFVIILGIPAGTPVQWAGNHRQHHKFTDTEKDPHSPYFGGLWHAHCGWYINSYNSYVCFLYSIAGPLRTLFDSYYRPRTNQEYINLANDINEDPILSFLSRPIPYMFVMLTHLLTIMTISFLLLGKWGILFAWLCSIYVYNIGDMIDSLGHYIGEQPFKFDHKATNNFIMALITFGDGWHASHHSFPSSARHGLLPGQFDWTFIMLKFFEKLGIVYNLKSIDNKTVLQALK